ncbi:MAG: phosphate acyltransferase PlsX [Eubacteriales bacterium]
MKIIVDAMGGDNAPTAAVLGAIEGSKNLNVDVALVGQGETILKVLQDNGIAELPKGVEIVHASEVVEMCDDPTTVMKEKKDASMFVGLRLLKEGGGDAFVSAGNTGALLAGATLLVKRIPGIRRAALAPVFPSVDGHTLLVDAGANAVCTSEYLLQFAEMGSDYAKQILKRDNPRIGLLNIGTEETKGTDLQLETFPLLQEAHKKGRLNFVGNVESRDGMLGVADVLVADGWTGNIFLKTMEGVGIFVGKELKNIIYADTKSKIAGALLKNSLGDFKKKLSSEEVGGTALLGVQKPVIKAHGSSSAYAFSHAVRQGKLFAESGLIDLWQSKKD